MRRKILSALVLLIATAGTVAGIQGSGFRVAALGTLEVSRNNTIKLGGVKYDVSRARVTVNGRRADPSELKTGHVVIAAGTLSPDEKEVIAGDITLESDVRGGVSFVDPRSSSLEVLGQTVKVTRKTAFDGALAAGGGIKAIEQGMAVRISGYGKSNGQFEATRIDLDDVHSPAQVRGVVESVNRDRRTLSIGKLFVDYSAAAVQGVVAQGAVVTVKGRNVAGSSELFATNVTVFAGIGSKNVKGDIEGIVTTFASRSDFEVNGQPVLANAGTKFHGGTLGTDVSVRVKGRFDENGVLVAKQIWAAKDQAVSAGGASARTIPLCCR